MCLSWAPRRARLPAPAGIVMHCYDGGRSTGRIGLVLWLPTTSCLPAACKPHPASLPFHPASPEPRKQISLGAAPYSNSGAPATAHPTIILKTHGQGRQAFAEVALWPAAAPARGCGTPGGGCGCWSPLPRPGLWGLQCNASSRAPLPLPSTPRQGSASSAQWAGHRNQNNLAL